MVKPVIIAFIAIPAFSAMLAGHAAAKTAADFDPAASHATSVHLASPPSAHTLDVPFSSHRHENHSVRMAALFAPAKEVRLFLDSPEIEKIPARKATMILYHQVDTMTTSGIGKSNRQQTKD
ncbi:MAG: hypothetical protein RIR97_472 [Pseudomonadota bacterium]